MTKNIFKFLLKISLLNNMKSLLNNPLFSDIKIRGNDGKEISAHRSILAVRSEVLKRMLLSEMKSTQDVIEFPEFSSNTLQIILEYLYTEKATLTTEIVVEAFRCADYFLLSQLKLQIIEFIKHYDVGDKINVLAKILSQLLERMESTNNELVDLLCNSFNPASLKLVEYSNLSAKALECILLNNTKKEEAKMFSISEYDSLYYIILWAANGISEEALSFYKSYLPSSEIFRSKTNMQEWNSDTPNIQESHAKYQSTMMTKTSSLFNYVNLEQIHPFIISNVIETLDGLIDLKKLYRKQALSLGGKYCLDDILLQWGWDDHAHGNNMYLDKTSSIVNSTSPSHGWIRTKVPISGQGLVEWDIVVDSICNCFWVGICTIKGFDVDCNSWLGKQEYGWVFGSHGFICHNTQQDNGPYTNKYGKKYDTNDRITVHLNMKKRTCFFSINGVKYPVAFRNLPDEIYPAVSLCSPGKARIEPHRERPVKRSLFGFFFG